MTPSSLARAGPWFRAAPSAIADPRHVPSSTARNRFNDGAGTFALLYFAPDPVTALLEAVAFHGSYATGFVRGPPPARGWTVFQYQIAQPLLIVDFADPDVRSTSDTTTQELTGDWLGYHHRALFGSLFDSVPPSHLPRVMPGHSVPPTQQLASDLYASTGAHGLLSPSAKAPTIANLAPLLRPPACLVVGPHRHRQSRRLAAGQHISAACDSTDQADGRPGRFTISLIFAALKLLG